MREFAIQKLKINGFSRWDGGRARMVFVPYCTFSCDMFRKRERLCYCRHKNVLTPPSDYKSEGRMSTLSNILDGEALIVEIQNTKFFQRAVATDTFHECASGRFDIIFRPKKCSERSHRQDKGIFSCWF